MAAIFAKLLFMFIIQCYFVGEIYTEDSGDYASLYLKVLENADRTKQILQENQQYKQIIQQMQARILLLEEMHSTSDNHENIQLKHTSRVRRQINNGLGATGATGPQGENGRDLTVNSSVLNYMMAKIQETEQQNYNNKDLYSSLKKQIKDGTLIGPTGATGPLGSTGPYGKKGWPGATGGTGRIGGSGATGASGISGLTGARGYAGPLGMVGATGSTGSTGPAGPTGEAGVVGPQGATG